jgi:hypothetical protein
MKHEAEYPRCIHENIHPCIEEEEEEVTFARYKKNII